jgi:hypothetical protein
LLEYLDIVMMSPSDKFNTRRRLKFIISNVAVKYWWAVWTLSRKI